eukprot:scaffold3324_cov371-Prasinococcus_capsulatus_cf.AAC.5
MPSPIGLPRHATPRRLLWCESAALPPPLERAAEAWRLRTLASRPAATDANARVALPLQSLYVRQQSTSPARRPRARSRCWARSPPATGIVEGTATECAVQSASLGFYGAAA